MVSGYLVWFFLGLVLLYLLMGRPPLPSISGLDFPALGLGASLIAWRIINRSGPLDPPAWLRLWRRLSQRPALLMAGGALLYALLLSLLSCLQHDRFMTSWDLGIFSQALWNTWHGDMLASSLRGHSLLGEHFHPMLFLLTPLYALLPTPQILLVLQSLALAAGAPAVYLLARRRQTGGLPAAGLSLLYLCHPGLLGANLFDFHVIVLACPLWLWHFALRPTRPGIAWLLAGLALICGEASFMVLAGLGIYDLSRGRWKKGALELAFGLAGFLLVVKLALPLLSGRGYALVNRYGYLGDGLGQIISTLIANPGLVLEQVRIPAKIDYLVVLMGGAMFLPFLRPQSLLLFLPVLGGIVLSDYWPQYSFHYHYSALLLAPIFAAAAQGLGNLKRLWDKLGPGPAWLFAALVLTGLISLDASPMGRLWSLLARPQGPRPTPPWPKYRPTPRWRPRNAWHSAPGQPALPV
jgi:uncharacterized membrane protein